MSSVPLSYVGGLRALAHPARLDLLDLFRVHDRLTAAECARLLGSSTKSCSYHLGILGRQGLVAQVAEAGGDGRKRPWRRVVGDIDFPVSPRGRGDQLRAMLVAAQRDLDLFTRFLNGETDPDEWSESVTVYTRTAVMDAQQLRAWGAAVEAVTREHVDRGRRQPPADHRPVRLTIRGFPQVFPTAAPPGD
jgi:Helix-turn-helix domain